MTREFEIPTSVAKKACDTYLRRFRRCVENPRMSLDEYRIDLWIEALGEDYEDLAEEIYVKWRKLRYRNLALSETTTNLLKTLHKQYQLAIVTNGPSQSQWEKIKELGIQDHFDAIVVSGDLKWEKPQPEIFHRVCSLLGVQPFECLIVGDKIETDILGGVNTQLGITVWMPLEEKEKEPGEDAEPTTQPDFIIHDLHQLIGILQGGNDKSKSKGLRTKGKGSSSSSSSGAAGASSSSTSSTANTTVPSTSGKTSSSTNSNNAVTVNSTTTTPSSTPVVVVATSPTEENVN